jgi:hypothetical protein
LLSEIAFEREKEPVMDISQTAFIPDASVSKPCLTDPPLISKSGLRPTAKRLRRYTRIDGVTYKIAETREEREGAFNLVYEAYTKGGLMDPNPYQMRVSPYHLQPTTDMFIAMHRDKVIYTLTLISDDFVGLPMQSIYEDELNERRQAGIYLAEVSCLASRTEYFPGNRMLDVFVQLLGLACQYSQLNNIDRLVIAIHPRHFRFYRRLLGITQIGGLKEYASVRNHPALAGEHDFARCEIERYPLYEQIYGYRFQRWELLRQPMLDDDREYFRPAAELCTSYAPVFAA